MSPDDCVRVSGERDFCVFSRNALRGMVAGAFQEGATNCAHSRPGDHAPPFTAVTTDAFYTCGQRLGVEPRVMEPKICWSDCPRKAVYDPSGRKCQSNVRRSHGG